MSAKGGGYEREVCTLLSKWWTGGKRDDIFWRTQGSGGRATNRSKKNLTTQGQYGDIAATDPEGLILLKVITFEIKRGYNKTTLVSSLDKPGASDDLYPEWMEKAEKCREHSKSLTWAIIHRRDKREAIITFPHLLWSFYLGRDIPNKANYILTPGVIHRTEVISFQLEYFILSVKPSHIRMIYETHCNKLSTT